MLPCALLLLLLPLQLQTPGAGALEITLDPPAVGGSLRVELHAGEASFSGEGRPAAARVFALDGEASFRLEGVPTGRYALLVHHDENDNGDLDRNFLGIPSEPLGFANGYRPTGRPLFDRATIAIEAGRTSRQRVELRRPLGKRGSIGVGLGAVVQGLPYRGASGVQVQAIPVIVYLSERLAILGPGLRYGLVNRERFRLLATLRARFGAYDEDDADILEGLGDRDTVALGGVGLAFDLTESTEMVIAYEHDLFDTVGGGEATLRISRSFSTKRVDWTPTIGVRWTHADLVRHDFGVPASDALPDRPVYEPDDALYFELGLGTRTQISDHLQMIGNLGFQLFDDEVSDSPLIEDDWRLSAVVGFVYTL